LVADDGSKDGSKEVIKNWIAQNDPATIFIDHKKNLGLTKNINSALPHIKGDYFQVFGCDDIMLPDKIERQVVILKANKDAGIVYSDMQLIDKGGYDLPYTYFQSIPISNHSVAIIMKALSAVLFLRHQRYL
jgi:glycosyltransferase involved in cell wall biosynthesis